MFKKFNWCNGRYIINSQYNNALHLVFGIRRLPVIDHRHIDINLHITVKMTEK